MNCPYMHTVWFIVRARSSHSLAHFIALEDNFLLAH